MISWIKKPDAVNLFDYVISFISSGKTDYIQRKVLIDILNKNIRNLKIIDDYYRQINEIIQSVRFNPLLRRKGDKIEELIQKYISEIFNKKFIFFFIYY